MATDLDKGGTGYHRSKVYLGPTLGWVDSPLIPARTITVTSTVDPGDSVVLVDVAAIVTVNLPDVVEWVKQSFGRPATGYERALWIKDLGGNATAFNITVHPFGGQLIDKSAANVVMNTNFQMIRLYPLFDLSGWYIESNAGINIPPGSIFDVNVNAAAAIQATKLDFIQAGTGAVHRTVQNKERDIFSVRDFGATGDGATDDTTFIQATIDAAAAHPNGRGTAYFPSTTAGAGYKITAPLVWKPNVNIWCDPQARIFAATLNMEAMLETGLGSGNRLRYCWLKGGRWDGAFLARRGIWLKDANGVWLTDHLIREIGTFVDGVSEAESSYIRVGDPGQSSTCYEIMVDRFDLFRVDDAGSPTLAPANNYGIYSGNSASDCHITNGVISGVKKGIYDRLAGWKIRNVHTWNFTAGHGTLLNAIHSTTFGCNISNCQTDCGTATVPYQLEGSGELYTINQNNALCVEGTDNVGTCVSIGSGAIVASFGTSISCDPAHRFATDFSGDLTGLTALGTISKNVVANHVNTLVNPLNIGFSAQISVNGINALSQLYGSNATAASTIGRFSADTSPPRQVFVKSRGAIGVNTVVQSGDELMSLLVLGADGTNYIPAASIRAAVDGTPGAADMPGRLGFFTTPDGAAADIERWRVDNAGRFLGFAPLAGLGYGTGAGGTVTQATSKATAVTLNNVCGTIVTNAANLAAGTIVSFVVNNTALVATDQLLIMHESGGTFGAYTLNGRATGVGTAAIDIRNNTGGGLAEALTLRFSVIKSVNS